MQFIIVTFYDEIITNKFYNSYAIIYVQYSPKPSHIKYYNIIRASYGQFTSWFH